MPPTATTIHDAHGRPFGLDAAPDEGRAPPPATPSEQEPLATTTVSAMRAMLDEHSRGIFLRSALLADLMRRDADVVGALVQRLLAFQALDAQVTGPALANATDAESAAWERAIASYAAERPALVPTGAQVDMLVDGCLMGFALGQLVPRWDEASQRLVRHLEPWPASAVEYDRREARWYALTLDRGRLAITPGDGQWALYTPRGHRAPYLWGAILSTAEWYIRDSDAASDASRHAEVFGNSIWKAKLPAGGRQTPDGKGFAGSLRTMGRNAVIPCPQGATPASSYDVELIEAKADAHAIFEWLLRAGGGRIRLAILGQDLTSQNNLVGTNASSGTGMTTLDRVVRAEGRSWSEFETRQIAAPRAAYLGDRPVRVLVEGEEEDRRKAEAEAFLAAGDALQKLQAAGIDVDVEAYARQFRVPLRTTPSSPKRGQLFAYHLQYQLVSTNEARELALGLPPVAGGDKPPMLAGGAPPPETTNADAP